MSKENQDISRLSPDRLVAGFAKSKVMLCILVALAVHVVVIGGLSVSYIRDACLGADERKPAAEKTEETPGKSPAQTQQGAPSVKPDAKKPGTEAQPPEGDASKDPLKKHKNDPLVKKVTDAAKPEEIPDKPDDLGVPIDETNP